MGLHLVIPFQYVFLGDVPFLPSLREVSITLHQEDTKSIPELRSHRHRRTLLTLLAALFGSFGGFQGWIATNEDGGNRTDGASNEGEEEGVIHAHRHRLLSNADMKSG